MTIHPSIAKELLHLHLEGTDRLKHSLGVTSFVQNILGTESDFSIKCISAALLHDIGYSTRLNKTGFHPYDGYVYLKELHIEEDVCNTVLYHSLADLDYQVNHDNKYFANYNESALNSNTLEMIDVVSYADWHTDGKGNRVSVDERFDDIINRHGKESKVVNFMLSIKPTILETCSKVESKYTTEVK